MTQIGSLSTSLTLESASFVSAVKKVQSSVDNLDRGVSTKLASIQKSAASLTSTITGSIAAFTGGAIVGALQGMVSSGLEYASSLGEVAQQLGVTSKTLQEYRYVATQVGVSQGEMDKGLERLTRSLGDAASGAKAPADAFKALGVSITDQNGALKSTDAVLPELIDAFSKIPDPARRAALEVDLFGKSGQKLDTLLSGGRQEVDNLRDAAHRLGVVLSEDQIRRADDTADKLASLQTVMKANISAAVADNADSILSLANALASLVSWTGNAIRGWGNLRMALAQKLNAAGGWNFDGSALGGEAAANARKRWYANDQAMKDAARPRFGWSDRQNAAIADGSYRYGLPVTAPKITLPKISTGGGGRGGSPGSGRASARSGPSLGDETKTIMDGLFPDAAQINELRDKAATLGKALSAAIIPQEDYNRAFALISDNITALQQKVQATVDFSAVDIALPAGANAVDAGGIAAQIGSSLQAQLAGAHSTNDAMTTLVATLNQLGMAGNGAFSEISATIADSLIPMIDQSTEHVRSLQDSMQGAANAFTTLFTAIFGKKIGGILGGIATIGVSVARAFGGGRAGGGPVLPNVDYLVGERGPEILRMGGQGGSIAPNEALRAPSRSVSFDLRGAVMTADLLQQMNVIAADTGGKLIGANNRSMARKQNRTLR